MIRVENKMNDNMKMLSYFKKLVVQEEILKMVKDRRYYIKPSLKKILKQKQAEKNRNKALIKDINAALKDEF